MMRRLSLTLLLALFFTAPAWAATPTLVQRGLTGFEGLASSSGYAAGTITVRLANPAGAGNALVIFWEYNSNYTSVTVSDDKANTWTVPVTVPDATNAETTKCAYALNVASGTQTITLTFSGSTQTAFFAAGVLEYYNVATISALDGSSGALHTAGPYAPGSITTTTAGDLIVSAYITTGVGATGLTSITPPTGHTMRVANTFLNISNHIGFAVADMVQGAAGAINPSWSTNSNNETAAAYVLAFKAATAGTAPTQTPRILGWQSMYQGTSPPANLPFPCFGNLIVGLYNDNNGYATAVTDSAANSWQAPVALQKNGNGNTAVNIIYAPNATCSSTLTYSLTTGGTVGDPFIKLYDITGAATSPLGATVTNSGTQTVDGALTEITITPQSSNSIIFVVDSHDYHTTNAMSSPTGGVLDSVVNNLDNNTPGGTNPSPLDEDNTYAHYYNSGTSALNFTFSFTTGGGVAGIQNWSAVGAEFKAPAAGGVSAAFKRQKLQRYYGEP